VGHQLAEEQQILLYLSMTTRKARSPVKARRFHHLYCQANDYEKAGPEMPREKQCTSSVQVRIADGS
jgi:hypothetical protein